MHHQIYTPWKFCIAPENISSQKESSLWTIIFQGLCWTSGVYCPFWNSRFHWHESLMVPKKGSNIIPSHQLHPLEHRPKWKRRELGIEILMFSNVWESCDPILFGNFWNMYIHIYIYMNINTITQFCHTKSGSFAIPKISMFQKSPPWKFPSSFTSKFHRS